MKGSVQSKWTMKTNLKLIAMLACCSLNVSCTYIQQTFKQAGYKSQFRDEQSRAIQKHLLTTETFFVNGKLTGHTDLDTGVSLAVAAVAETNAGSEVVDINHFARVNSFYGLNLPAGGYQLVVLADLNDDGFYTDKEVLTGLKIDLNQDRYPYHVANGLDFDIGKPVEKTVGPIRTQVAAKQVHSRQPSLFYPKGSIRQLDDPVFAQSNALLGMYSPADFMEMAPMMFYALEEDYFYKIPVVFVHGIGGSVTDFSSIIARLDRDHYKPWFYYYPSGADLDKLAHLFYRIFLSGNVVHLDPRTPLIIVAHSMGGLVVRKALNDYKGDDEENKVRLFISIATPFGGHPDATAGIEAAPLVLPSWYDLNPEGAFIKELYRQAIPEFTQHHLIYAYGNQSSVKLGENSDGVVPLSSQLYPLAQNQSTRQYGYNHSHTGILNDDRVVTDIIDLISEHRSYYPESHLDYMVQGGFDVDLSSRYTPREQYAIQHLGHFIRALANGRLKPFDRYEAHFIDVLNGVEEPNLFTESAWLKFRSEYPEFAVDQRH